MFEFRLPDVGEGVSEGELLEWHVAPGDEIEEDQVLAEVETDKAVVDLPSPVAGTVETLHAEPGDVVPVGTVIITIDPADPSKSNVSEAPTPEAGAGDDDGGSGASVSSGRVFAPPSVRRLARELDVDIGNINGTGPGGRITEADVEAAAGTGGAADEEVADAITAVAPEAEVGETDEEPGPTPAITRADDASEAGKDASTKPSTPRRERTLATPATRRLAEELDIDIDAVPTEKTRDGEAFVERTDVSAYAEAQQTAQAADAETVADSSGAPSPGEASGDARETREPYRGIRRTIGERMAESAFTIPHVTHHDRAVVPDLVEARDAANARASEKGDRITYMPFVLKAVVAALREYPVLNTSLDEEAGEVIYKHFYDIGVATATEAGLMVPVVEDVDKKGLLQLSREIRDLTERAQDRSIEVEELRGSTFTVTNFGAIGGEYATPLINHPETAILGLGAIEQRPAVVNGELVAESTLPLSLSIDHRVIDGAEAAGFVNTVIKYLETPSLLLLE
ncbi:MAG: 2-oxo acid dehydrogenase subunit E2 [Salinirussus sp.]